MQCTTCWWTRRRTVRQNRDGRLERYNHGNKCCTSSDLAEQKAHAWTASCLRSLTETFNAENKRVTGAAREGPRPGNLELLCGEEKFVQDFHTFEGMPSSSYLCVLPSLCFVKTSFSDCAPCLRGSGLAPSSRPLLNNVMCMRKFTPKLLLTFV